MKSRMRENRTYGSVRGSRQAFHMKYIERSVETVYSTNIHTTKGTQPKNKKKRRKPP